jgi:hypothetical protein
MSIDLSNSAQNTGLVSIMDRVTHVSLHTALPDRVTGSNEVTGGGYARLSSNAAAWPISGTPPVATLGADLEFDGPAAGTASHFGLWDGSTFLGRGAISGDTAFNSAGEFLLKAGSAVNLNRA